MTANSVMSKEINDFKDLDDKNDLSEFRIDDDDLSQRESQKLLEEMNGRESELTDNILKNDEKSSRGS